jgi:hypothetical protein
MLSGEDGSSHALAAPAQGTYVLAAAPPATAQPRRSQLSLPDETVTV